MHADYLLLYCNEHATTQMMNEDEKGLCYSAMICMHACMEHGAMHVHGNTEMHCRGHYHHSDVTCHTLTLCVCARARWYRGAVVPEVNTGPHQIDVGRI